MRRFLLRSSAFVIGVNILALAIQIIVFACIRSVNIGGFGKLNAIHKGEINSEILICGSSRGESHYNPEIISRTLGFSCYNISIDGSRLGVQLAVLKWYLKTNRAPLYLIQNIDVFTVELDPYIYEPFRYLPYLAADSLYDGLLRIDRRLWMQKYIPLTNLIYFNKKLQKTLLMDFYLALKSKQDPFVRGYSPNHKPWIGDGRANEFLRSHSDGIFYKLSREHLDFLEELVRICREHRIELIFVVSPEREETMRLQKNRQAVADFYTHFCIDHHVMWLDYSRSALCGNKEIWVNFSHMKSIGADLFSIELSLDLCSRLVRPQPIVK